MTCITLPTKLMGWGLKEAAKQAAFFFFLNPDSCVDTILITTIESLRLKVIDFFFQDTCYPNYCFNFLKNYNFSWYLKHLFFFITATVADLEVKTREKLEAAKKKTSFEIAELKERLKASRETINCLKNEIRKLEEDDQSKDMWQVLTCVYWKWKDFSHGIVWVLFSSVTETMRISLANDWSLWQSTP